MDACFHALRFRCNEQTRQASLLAKRKDSIHEKLNSA